MSWFNQKKEEKKSLETSKLPELPRLPELPKLPELPEFREDKNERPTLTPINQLPSFPKNTLGEKFSQDIIKEAVTGKKEGDRWTSTEAPMFPTEDDEELMMPRSPLRQEIEEPTRPMRRVPQEFREAATIVRKAEPIFIRIDKFEESLKTFEKAKGQIKEIEHMLNDIKRIKDEEEKELEYWEREMQALKDQIEKVDRDIFSKIE